PRGGTLLRGSYPVIGPEDGGSLSDYLQSLAILRAMTMDGRIGSIHPGHGPAYETPLEALEAIEQAIAHRHERIEEVRRARTAGVVTIDRLLRVVYGPDLPEQLEGAARRNLRATLDHLAGERCGGASAPGPARALRRRGGRRFRRPPVRCGVATAAGSAALPCAALGRPPSTRDTTPGHAGTPDSVRW